VRPDYHFWTLKSIKGTDFSDSVSSSKP
jgi:hypothetical protein